MNASRNGVTSIDPDQDLLPLLPVAQLPVEQEPRRWLVEGLWGASAVGLVGGAPKCCKSWLGLDLAVSVATGTPCLRCFPVHETGPALVYLAEDSVTIVRERVSGLARSRGLSLSEINLNVITASSIRLDRQHDQDRLQRTIDLTRPRILVLDPLVRLHSIDENSASEVAQLLSYIRNLQREFDVAIVLVHHTRKNAPSGTQAGQGLRGSGDWHAFGDSNLYLRRQRSELILTMEHRSSAAPDPITVELIDDRGAVHLCARKLQARASPDLTLDDRILALFANGERYKRAKIRELLGVRNQGLGEALQRLQESGKLRRVPDGYECTSETVPRSHL